MNKAEESRVFKEVMAALLSGGEELHEAYHQDAEFRHLLDVKVRLLVLELDPAVLASETRRQGRAMAAQALSNKIQTFTAPKKEQS
jgi:hypothetical protein